MIQLSRRVEYALVALQHIYRKAPGDLTTVKEVCDQCGSPFDATSRVMQRLANKGLLRSEQGAHGGYILIRDLSKISFLELMEIVLGSSRLAKCFGRPNGEPCQMESTCNIIRPLNYLNQRLADLYKKLTLKEILEGHPPKEVFPSVALDGPYQDLL